MKAIRDRKEIGIGMIGYKFMGKAHSHAYRDLPFFFETECVPVLRGIAGRDEAGVKTAAERYGFATYETDFRRLIERGDIDVIDIVTSNVSHAEIALAAIAAGKHVLCEKPLAMTLSDARRMRDAARDAGVVNMVCHNYRFAPAVQLAKRLIDEGRLGRIYHFRGRYLQDWTMDPNFPLVWRMRKEVTGSGAHGDILSHILDLGRFLIGEFSEVVGMMETFIKQRPLCEMADGLKAQVSGEAFGEVDVDDMSAFMARFENGTVGVFEATRFAGGSRNANQFEINGEKGSIRWNLEDMNWLHVYFHDDEPGLQGYRAINCTESEHPYAGAYWPPGHIIGYEHTFIHLMRELMVGIAEGTSHSPNFEDGVRNEEILTAVEESARTKSWIRL